ncbi:3'-5' exonuclease [Sphingobacterium corticibacterium]|uniref:3'-5' exonuclease n=1 Tax=Sphingobacterium corticibacterium TaxID=2484746 RepID=A0A4Q6XNW4_9SPHI|nr:3'-5' exonuclease [Sphingobacterium corticibacterium]RZF61883.1 3'-5' exonuclease [Sphingobacterium corticibacterium]
MKHYLFIDTETSGIPQRWNRPYSDEKNWPHVIQVAWIIYDVSGTEIKRTSKYIYEGDIDITPASYDVHGITRAYLKQHGDRRKAVLRKLAHDIQKYNPVIIGHFVELDVQVLSADYYRANLPNPFISQSFFCTMLDSEKYATNPSATYLRLPQLHEYLFDNLLTEIHEAEQDANATAKCFFELWNRHEITSSDMERQQKMFSQKLNFLDK